MSQKESYEQPGGSLVKTAAKVFGYTVMAAVMSLFLSFSINMLSAGLFTETIGYKEYENVDGQAVLIDTVYFEEGETYSSSQVVNDDDRLISRELITRPKNDVCAGLAVAAEILKQLLMLALLLGLPGYLLHREGDRDRNLVDHHDEVPQPLKGLWAGSLASVPAACVYALLALGKAGVWSDAAQGIYRFFNTPWLPIVNVIMPQEVYPATAVEVWQLLLLALLLLPVPAACAAAYVVGYRRLIRPKKKKKKKA